MRKKLALIILLLLVALSFFLSVLYFANPEHRREKIQEYKNKIEKRRPQ
ncbi:MAG: hypothetical protein WHS43_02465 [Aquificaceae bacterium]|jgi:outer membrane lipoprotein-sorting protein